MAPQFPVVVHKFGGAALADAAAIANVGAILSGEPAGQPRVVVTSALQGVTNALLAATRHAIAGETLAMQAIIDDLRARHLATVHSVVGTVDATAEQRRSVLSASVDAACDELARQLVALSRQDGSAELLSDAILAHGSPAVTSRAWWSTALRSCTPTAATGMPRQTSNAPTSWHPQCSSHCWAAA